MEATLQYPVAQFDITLEDVSVVATLKTLLKQMKGVRNVSVKTKSPKVKMTESEFYAKIDRSLAETKNNPTYKMYAEESGEEFLNRLLQVG